MDTEGWRRKIEQERTEKDAFFASHPQSPFSAPGASAFSGLSYWTPAPAYRFELPLHEHGEKTILEVQDTGGATRTLLRWGEFRFEVDGRACGLQAYRTDPAEDRLFLPFRDQTSGTQSYGAGRYLDLEAERDQADAGQWVLDFNRAYNHWCAYSGAYVCPFVPPENWLPVPIPAGEKSYS